MRRSRRLLLFLNWFASGLFTPIMSLMLLERGCTLETLPLVLGAFSATVLVCEVPSGVCADLMGRKRTFLLSCGLYTLSFAALLFSRGVWALLCAYILYGVARAFSSGSLDALFIEECVRKRGEEALPAAAGQLSLWQITGLAAGALAGGALPNWNGYSLHILARAGFLVLTALLCLVLVKEERIPREKAGGTTLRRYLAEAAGLARGNGAMGGLLLCFFASGALMGLVETFWQPDFAALVTEAERPLLGVVSAVGFFAAALGNLAVQRMLFFTGKRAWGAYLAARAVLAACAALLALQSGAAGFLAVYGSIYLLNGGTDVVEQTLLNRMAPDAQRAGLLSAASFTVQAGALLACGFASAAVGRVGFSGLFLAGGAVVLLCALGAAALKKGIRNKD